MIESHVVNYEFSRRLHEMGVNKQSIFSWAYICLPGENINNGKYRVIFSDDPLRMDIEKIPAYIASELLEMLPDELFIWDKIFNKKIELDFTLKIFKEYATETEKWWLVFYDFNGMYASESICKLHLQKNDFLLQNALTNMFIYLIENKLVDVDDINK